MVSNVQSHYRKVTQGTLRNPEFFVNSYLRPTLSLFQQPCYCWERWSLSRFGNDLAGGFFDAVVGDGFAIDRTI